MSGKKLKKKKKIHIKPILCPNCGEKGPHFVPPSLGEPGFFICKKPKLEFCPECGATLDDGSCLFCGGSLDESF